MRSTDRQWQAFGEVDPYFGVASHPEFSGEMSESARSEFFSGGEAYVAHVYDVMKAKVDAGFDPVEVLDFGCGVGRLLLPLSSRCAHVIGVDISCGMLREARANLIREAPQCHYSLLKTDDALANLPPASVDFVHSTIVLQHIRPHQGMEILEWLTRILRSGGAGCIHVTFSTPGSHSRRTIRWLRGRSSFVNGVLNRAQRKAWKSPYMEMHEYPLREVFALLQQISPSGVYIEWTEHSQCRGATFYFRKELTASAASTC